MLNIKLSSSSQIPPVSSFLYLRPYVFLSRNSSNLPLRIQFLFLSLGLLAEQILDMRPRLGSPSFHAIYFLQGLTKFGHPTSYGVVFLT
ncbi:hypothetical protein M413DRAFT_391299 [Hebeloma cylindrosporum]|uniref:Uncharacterized protein n=1 Tax=Hebeloma cylindrosporum TaxID=76867 RepID=A0A0C2X9V9_HEBCY|nr:hypothetical protein M413DRAFT_391299 [Hebeloma cylindrosporum h7]